MGHLAPRPHAEPVGAQGDIALIEWSGSITIDLPEGTVRHPRMLGLVHAYVGRLCVLNLEHGGVDIDIELAGDTHAAAEADCHRIARGLLGLLGLPPSALRRCRTYERPSFAESSEPSHLKVLPH